MKKNAFKLIVNVANKDIYCDAIYFFVRGSIHVCTVCLNHKEYYVICVTHLHSFNYCGPASSGINGDLGGCEMVHSLFHFWEQLFVHDDNSYLDAFPLFYRPGDPEMVRVTQGLFGFKKKHLVAYFPNCLALTKALYEDTASIRTVPELYEFCLAHCIP